MTGEYWRKKWEILSLEITTCEERMEVAKIIKQNLQEIGIKTTIRKLSNSYYRNNLKNLSYEILLTGNTVSIKPNIQEYLNFDIESKQTQEQTYEYIYTKYKNKPNFMGLYFNSIILLYSNNLKGNFECNWYNIFYNVDTWYKVME